MFGDAHPYPLGTCEKAKPVNTGSQKHVFKTFEFMCGN